ncbi:hypothetical protein AYI69_g4899 [Smittium culicis]|uniref:Uncharacterized protein n=1 Tax=Smittium culicis TaxID=133412 RepID=A0A1R1Y9N1_9FUNG|nr:hypothetical protein AYI69_g4899 [Smittium culicis]
MVSPVQNSITRYSKSKNSKAPVIIPQSIIDEFLNPTHYRPHQNIVLDEDRLRNIMLKKRQETFNCTQYEGYDFKDCITYDKTLCFPDEEIVVPGSQNLYHFQMEALKTYCFDYGGPRKNSVN